MRVGFCPFRGSGAPLRAARILVQHFGAGQGARTVTRCQVGDRPSAAREPHERGSVKKITFAAW